MQQQSQQQAPQAQGRGMSNPNVRPFMQTGTMPIKTGQPQNQFARGAMNPNQPAVRLQHQQQPNQFGGGGPMQQQQQQQQQHMGQQQQHYQF